MGLFDKIAKIFTGGDEEPLDNSHSEDVYLDFSRDLTRTQQEVYDAVRAMPGGTAREFGFLYFPEDWRIPGRRLKELVDLGLVVEGECRRNNDTEILVKTYYPATAEMLGV